MPPGGHATDPVVPVAHGVAIVTSRAGLAPDFAPSPAPQVGVAHGPGDEDGACLRRRAPEGLGDEGRSERRPAGRSVSPASIRSVRYGVEGMARSVRSVAGTRGQLAARGSGWANATGPWPTRIERTMPPRRRSTAQTSWPSAFAT